MVNHEERVAVNLLKLVCFFAASSKGTLYFIIKSPEQHHEVMYFIGMFN